MIFMYLLYILRYIPTFIERFQCLGRSRFLKKQKKQKKHKKQKKQKIIKTQKNTKTKKKCIKTKNRKHF